MKTKTPTTIKIRMIRPNFESILKSFFIFISNSILKEMDTIYNYRLLQLLYQTRLNGLPQRLSFLQIIEGLLFFAAHGINNRAIVINAGCPGIQVDGFGIIQKSLIVLF